MTKEKLAIKAMTIEGFGRFQEATRIEFAPVTFLIGPNGAGKSTVGRVLGILRRAFGDTEGPDGGMVPGEEFKVWFEFAEAIAPRGLQFGYSISIDQTPFIKSRFIGTHDEIALVASLDSSNSLEKSYEHYRYARDMMHRYEIMGNKHTALVANSENHIVDEDLAITIELPSERVLRSMSSIDCSANAYIHKLYYNLNWDILTRSISEEYMNSFCLVRSDSFDECAFMEEASLIQPYAPRSIAPLARIKEFLVLNDTDFTCIETELEIFCGGINDEFRALKCVLSNLNNRIEIDELSSFADFTLQLYELAKLVDILDALDAVVAQSVVEFSSAMPAQLTAGLPGEWLHEKSNEITKGIVRFATSDMSTTAGYDRSITHKYKKAFIDMFGEHFGMINFDVQSAFGRYSRLLVTLAGGEDKLVPINRMGRGFGILFATYAWLIEKLTVIHTTPGILPHDHYAAPCLKLSPKYPYDTSSIAIAPIVITQIEELESGLHPNLQSMIFSLLVGHATGTNHIQRDYDEWMGAFEPKTITLNVLNDFDTSDEAQEARQNAIDSAYSDLYFRCLIFETHSEYIIRTALTMVARGDYEPDMFAINYIHAPATQPEGEPPAYHIPIRSNGTLSREFGPGFFDEAQRLKLELIELNRVQANQAN